MKSHPTEESLKQVEEATCKLLNDIGVPYKKVSRYEFVDEEGTAVWTGESEETGFIKIYRGCDPEAVAHEIGHGFLEAMNYNKKAQLPAPFRRPEDGEAVAEAVRFFVEQRRGSSWRPSRDLQTLEYCDYDFDTFKRQVKALVRAETKAPAALRNRGGF